MNTYNSENVCFGFIAEDVSDVINRCGDILIQNGCITHRYIDSMIETLDKFGPYMVLIKDVALFHGVPGQGVIENGICLVHLDKRLKLTDSTKTIKLAFAFCSKDGEGHVEIIKEFAQMLMDEHTVGKLLESKNKEELLNVLNGGM